MDHASSLQLKTRGYPGDKEKGTMWESFQKGKWPFDPNRDVLSSPGVSYHGQSGSPIYKRIEEKSKGSYAGTVYGVLTSGTNHKGMNGEGWTGIEKFCKEEIEWIKNAVRGKRNQSHGILQPC